MDSVDGWDDDKGEEDLPEEEKLIDGLYVQGRDDAGKLPEIYRIPGESDEVGSFSDLIERVEHIKDPGYLRPDEVGDKKLDLLSGMDKLTMYITNKIQNCFVYTRFRTDDSRFQAEFVAITTVNGKTYTSSYLTPGYAIGMTDGQAAREGDIIIESLAKNLGIRAFAEKTPHIPEDAFMTFIFTEKW